ncbi:MAG: hypothetical protein COV66_01360 [Nitrospinae bacterium CG11_big_fil_rev_8_21_14_0_20_45_15]|nr:MAG: hypothetical protein COV66_01360 [Nitrospinae bacterium CG11_big_fil_rev_8_21_14_0_20_45_15]
MFVLDLIITGFIGYLLVSRLRIIPFIVERGALAILIGAGVKSLSLFAFILLGFQPVLALQLPVSLSLLFATFFFFKPGIGATNFGDVPRIADGFSWAKIISPIILFVLLALSVKMALNVPITEADGIWYHIKGMAYFHSADLNSEAVTVQMRQYPPFVSLIFCYMISGQIETVKVLFPILFLSLLLVFYYRTLAQTHNGELAAIFTLILGSTPYLWWHSSLPFLDLTVGTFYGLGTIYAFFIARELKKPASLKQAQSWALLSGCLFGLAGWTRWEYLIYDLAPVILMFLLLNRMASLPHIEKKKIISCFCLPLLALPTLWCLIVLVSGSPSYSKTPEVMFVCAGLWVFFLWMTISNKAEARIEPKNLVFPILYGALIFMAFALMRGLDGLFYNGSVALFRLIAGPLFFAFTPVIALLFFIKRQALSDEAKFLAAILLGFVILHLGVFTYADLKWGEWQEYVRATFFKPGSSINLSDVRGMIAFYPAFVFFIAILPAVEQSFSDRRKIPCP